MTANIIGPGQSGDQSTSSRPDKITTGLGVWQWFRDCTSEAAQDGTRIRADFLNKVIAQLRYAIQGMGVTEAEGDDTMLLQCFQKLQFTNWLNLPIYPESLQGSYVLSVSNLGGGQVRVDAGQEFLHRGWNKVATNDYSDANRTVNHSANKTYHLRWQYNGGSPIFVIKDAADGVYNPGALAETNEVFDSSYDDMLIAKIVTDGSNVPTITTLKNATMLKDQIEWTGEMTSNKNDNHARASFSTTFNWARTPKASASMRFINYKIGGTNDEDMAIHFGDLTIPQGTQSAAWYGHISGATVALDRYHIQGMLNKDGANALTADITLWADHI